MHSHVGGHTTIINEVAKPGAAYLNVAKDVSLALHEAFPEFSLRHLFTQARFMGVTTSLNE